MNKRQISGEKYNVKELVSSAISKVDGDAKLLKTAKAESALVLLGHKAPTQAQVTAYAREAAILLELTNVTQANFVGQIGKWDFGNLDSAIQSADEYLNRRSMGQKQNFAKKYLNR